MAERKWIMIAGPYSSGGASSEQRVQNLRALNKIALLVLRKGHVPIIGVNLALPMIEVAGPECFDEIMMPVSLAIADRCDAVLRVGGTSAGADEELERIRSAGGDVYLDVSEVPDLNESIPGSS